MRANIQHTSDPTEPWTPALQAEFIQGLQDSQDGDVKQASEGATAYTRRILRESSFLPAIQPVKPITAADLIPMIDPAGGEINEIGVYLCEMEPGSPGAVTVPTESAPTQNTYRGARYTVAISKDQTEELYKTIDQLALYKMDLRQVVTDNSLKDLDNVADFRWIQTVKDITGSNTAADGLGGYRQYREVSGGITRTNYKHAFRPLMDATLNNGVFLMSRQTANEFTGWGRDEVGGDKAQEILLKGMNALESFEINNTPHIASIKALLLPFGEVYHFAPSNFLGQYLEYQAPTIFIKRERETITTFAQRKYGVHIANVKAVARTKFLS